MIPASIRMVVVLPAPSGPTRPKISPAVTWKVRPARATVSPKRLVHSRRRSMAFMARLSLARQRDLGVGRHPGLELRAPGSRSRP